MRKSRKKIEDFLFNEKEIHYVEKAIYALIDRLKEDRLDRKFDLKDEKDITKLLESCFTKLKLQRNFLIRKDLYIIEGINEEQSITSTK